MSWGGYLTEEQFIDRSYNNIQFPKDNLKRGKKMKDYKLLLLTRHLARDGESENILPTELKLVEDSLKINVEDIAREFNVSQLALVSGYKTIDGHFGRTQNTAEAFGYEFFIPEKILSFSPKEGWEKIPFGKGFKEFSDAYQDKNNHGAIILSDTHAGLYRNIVDSMQKVNGKHVFTHDSRVEAACAKLVPQYSDKLGAPLDYGETLALISKDQQFTPLAIVRRDGIQEVYRK
jgi:hypothetical protein